jgi:subtilisin family serine protease
MKYVPGIVFAAFLLAAGARAGAADAAGSENQAGSGAGSDSHYSFRGGHVRLLVLPDQIAVIRKDGSAGHGKPLPSLPGAWDRRVLGRDSRRHAVELLTRSQPASTAAAAASTQPDPSGQSAAWRKALAADPGVLGVRPVFFDPQLGLRLVGTDRIIVKSADAALIRDLPRRFPIQPVRDLRLQDAHLFRTDGDPLAMAARLDSLPGVEWAEPDFLGEMRPTLVPNDAYFDRQQYLRNTGQNGAKPGADLKASQAWDICWSAADVTVALFDDGVDAHPDLNIAPGGKNWIDDPPSDDVAPSPNASGHGVSCAGVIGAIGNNSMGVVGVAPGAKIMPMRITDWPDDGFASNASMADAILYAADHADVGSVSIIGIRSSVVEAALQQAAERGRKGKGFIFFTSAGNEGNGMLSYPSLYAYSVSVGAATDEDLRADYSQWGAAGKTVEFLAPSSGGRNGIATTDRVGALGFAPGDYDFEFGGTSAATPIAAGVAALMLATNPELTRGQILNIMRATCDRVGPLSYMGGINPQYGHGRVNAFEALKRIPPYIAVQPRDTLVPPNTLAYLSVGARGYQNRFQWQKESSPGIWGEVAGATYAIFSLNAAALPDSGRYRCIVINANGGDTSAPALLRLKTVAGISGPAAGPAAALPAHPTLACLPRGSSCAFAIGVPRSGSVRLDWIQAGNGRSRTVVDQFLPAGNYRIDFPYQMPGGMTYAYRLTVRGETVSGTLFFK